MLEKLLKQLPDSVLRKDYYRLRQQLLLAKRYPDKIEKTLKRTKKIANFKENLKLRNQNKEKNNQLQPNSLNGNPQTSTITNNP